MDDLGMLDLRKAFVPPVILIAVIIMALLLAL